MSIVISAPLGAGKTLYCMSEIDRISKSQPNRRIYTNIIGCSYPGTILIQSTTDKPFDWRDLPNGSVLVYDEAHEHPAFSKDDLLKTYQIDETPYLENIDKINARDDLKVKEKEELVRREKKNYELALLKAKEDILDIGRSLTLHRHFGIDIYFITQKPERLNNSVRASVTKHLILRRLFNLKASTIYEYVELQDQFGFSTIKNALSWKFWRFPKTMYKFYISAEEHPQRTNVPFGLYGWALISIALIGFGVFNAYNKNFLGLGKKQDQVEVKKQTSTSQQQTSNPSDPTITPDIQAKIDNCQKQLEWTYEQCRVTFDTAYDQKKKDEMLSRTQNDMQTISVKYNPNKPFETQNIQDSIQYDVTAKPVLAGCMTSKNGKLQGYTQQGTKLDVSQEDCKKIIAGDRPFNYFSQQQQNQQFQTQQNTNIQQQQTTKTMSPTEYAKYLQYLEEQNQSQNYVQDNLRHNPINGAHAL